MKTKSGKEINVGEQIDFTDLQWGDVICVTGGEEDFGGGVFLGFTRPCLDGAEAALFGDKDVILEKLSSEGGLRGDVPMRWYFPLISASGEDYGFSFIWMGEIAQMREQDPR